MTPTHRPPRFAASALTALGASLLLAACTTPPAGPTPAPPPPSSTPSAPPPPAPAPPPPPPPQSSADDDKPADDGARFARPAGGAIVGRYNGNSNKGIDYQRSSPGPVRAVDDGQVVLVSSALRGYGTMVLVRHDKTYLSAYAQLGKVLVKEKQRVKRGEQIAEMSATPEGRGRLHFELRRKGVAIDPTPLLPKD